jgi:protein involved in polysaccharide export with SLBB domain
MAVESSYVLTPGDSIQVTVFQEDELNRTSRIGDNGVVYLPLIGPVRMGGMTVPQAVSMVEELLRKDFLVNPQVTINVLQLAMKQITILGQVTRPGVYEIASRQSMDVLQAIGMAGGYTRIAHPGHITVKRTEAGEEKVYKIDGKRMASREDEEPFRVLPGDVITVGESIF